MKTVNNQGYREAVLRDLNERKLNMPKMMFEIQEKKSYGWEFYGVISCAITDSVMTKSRDNCSLNDLATRQKTYSQMVDEVEGKALLMFKWLPYMHWRIARQDKNGEWSTVREYDPQFDVSEKELKELIAAERKRIEDENKKRRERNNEKHKQFLAEHPGYAKQKRDEYNQRQKEKADRAKQLTKKLKAMGVLK